MEPGHCRDDLSLFHLQKSSGLRKEVPVSERSSIKSVSLLKVTCLPLALRKCCCLIELAENQRELCHLNMFIFEKKTFRIPIRQKFSNNLATVENSAVF